MAKRSLIDHLNQAVEAVLTQGGGALPPTAPGLAALVEIASGLRGLPREEFKARLKSDLERKANMATRAVKPIREGFHTVTPLLAVRKAKEVIDFIQQAFGAQGAVLLTGEEGGGTHAEYRIGDSMVMIGGGENWQGTPMPTALHLYVEDVDAVYQRALEAGAQSIYGPTDQEYGDREAGVRDVAGNQWYIATHRGASYVPEGLRTLTPGLAPRGAAKMIEFLKQAFGAEEAACYKAPDGTILHAKVRVGDSMIEIGEAHGEIAKPMPTVFYLYVEDVDDWYERSLRAGATSLQAPANQPYGDRVALVQDSFGNMWYIATHIKDVEV